MLSLTATQMVMIKLIILLIIYWAFTINIKRSKFHIE